MLWSEAPPGTAFRIREKGEIGRIMVKLQRDPFGSPIGDLGCINPYSGETHYATEFIDLSKPLEGQVYFVDLMEMDL